MRRGFHAIIIYALLTAIYAYLLHKNIGGLEFLILVIMIAYGSGKVAQLIPSYDVLIERLDLFWMNSFTFMFVILPGIVYDSFISSGWGGMLVLVTLILLLYLIPCILSYRYLKPEFTYSFRLVPALMYFWKSKYQIIEDYNPRNRINVANDIDGGLVGYIYYSEIHQNVQVLHMNANGNITAFIPLNEYKDEYVKIKWSIDKNMNFNSIMNTEFEKVWAMLELMDKLNESGNDSDHILDSMKVSCSKFTNEVELVNGSEYNRSNFSRFDV